MTISEILDWYESIEAELFPLNHLVVNDRASKKPLQDGWRTRHYTREQIEAYLANGHGIGWRLKSTDFVIDVEVATPDGHKVDGRASFETLAADYDLSVAPTVTAPHGGKHHYFSKPEGGSISKHLSGDTGIEFLSEGRYVVIAGSPHWQGGGNYELSSATIMLDLDQPVAPAALLAALEKPEVERSTEAAQLTPDQLKDYLSFLDACDFAGEGGGRWAELLMACHHATGGDPEGFAVFEEWCDGDPSYAGDASRKVRWNSCHADRNNGFTAATLFHFVNDAIDALPAEERTKAESRLAALESEGLFGPVDVDKEDEEPIRIEIKYDESKAVGAAATAFGCV